MKLSFSVVPGLTATDLPVRQCQAVVPDWIFVGPGKDAGTELPWNDDRFPEELSADWRSAMESILGEAKVSSREIAGKRLEWSDKELQ